MKTHWHLIGKIGRAHGLRGEVEAWIFSQEDSLLREGRFYRVGGVERKLRDFRKKGRVFLLHFEGIEDRSLAEALNQMELEVPLSFLISGPRERIFLAEILNFKLVDPVGNFLGRIQSFSSNGLQDLLVLDSGDEIPFVQDFLISIDWEASLVRMNLPDGLLALNSRKKRE
ncbi:MAG: ribosome maturation factor RimM [Bdellovibrio sp.]